MSVSKFKPKLKHSYECLYELVCTLTPARMCPGVLPAPPRAEFIVTTNYVETPKIETPAQLSGEKRDCATIPGEPAPVTDSLYFCRIFAN